MNNQTRKQGSRKLLPCLRDHSNILKYILDAAVIMVLIPIVLQAMWMHRADVKPAFGTPVQFKEKIDINKISIDQVANDHARLYLLEEHTGVLRIFDLEVFSYITRGCPEKWGSLLHHI